MEPFSLSSCMCRMAQPSPLSRQGRERGCSDPKALWSWCAEPRAPRVLPGPNPESEQQCSVCHSPLHLAQTGTYLCCFQNGERMSFPQFHRLGSKEGKGELKCPWLWGQCNQARQRLCIFQSSTMVFFTLQFSWVSPATAQVFRSVPWVSSQISRIWEMFKLVTTHEEFGFSNLPGITLAEALEVLIP